MSVPYYIGAKAIAARLGYRSPRMVMKLMLTEGLPVYKRRHRNAKNTRCYMTLAASESAITAWELAKGQHFVNVMRARQQERGRVYGYRLTA